MRPTLALLALIILSATPGAAVAQATNAVRPDIIIVNPPEMDFFSKQLDYCGIPIKAHKVVSDTALYEARTRLDHMLNHLPTITSNLVTANVAVHIIGKDQVTTDLPEWRQDKGKPLAEYNGLTRDQRTRGMGGRLVSCGEENLLKLEQDKYRGRDICVHEFAHAIRNRAMSRQIRSLFDQQYHRSLKQGLWVNSYAASNPDEFFSELSMWYFGTHGDMNMNEPKPSIGSQGLKNYDPEAFTLFEDFYQGRLSTLNPPSDPQPKDQ